MMIKNITHILLILMLFYTNFCKAEIRVAVVVPKTGEYKVWGDELIMGAQTAVNQINQTGGINGEKLELISIDDTCSENLAVSTAQMLSVSSSVKPALVVGPYCSNSFSDVAKIYSKAKIFQVVPTTLNYHDAILEHKGVMKLVAFKEQAGKDFFDLYNQKYAGLKTALVFDNKTDGVKETVTAISDEFRKHGKSSLLKQFNFAEYKNLDSLAETIVSSDYKIVYLAGSPKKTAKIIRKINNINKDTTFFINKSAATDAFFENANGYLDNVYFMALPSLENNITLTEDLVNLRLQGIEFDGLNIYGYTAVKMWADLVEKSGSVSYDKVVADIQNNKINNVWQNLFFNNTDMKNPLHYKFYRFNNGEFILAD
ncbi:MAG: amino acid ABC transporter substrate-binding protein [Alphaproteobacteria bacterium]|nr:amino acid ABC transporter substrate-binding protein [Alphaproteobacteria bacterium]